jgi:hypothetical protein
VVCEIAVAPDASPAVWIWERVEVTRPRAAAADLAMAERTPVPPCHWSGIASGGRCLWDTSDGVSIEQLKTAILDLGLEDWIPLPEAMADPTILDVIGSEDAEAALRDAHMLSFAQGK